MKKCMIRRTAMLMSLVMLLTLLPGWAGAEESISEASVFLAPEVFEYNGDEHMPEVAVTLNGVPLVEGEDYTVACKGNVKPGEGTVIVTGIGAYTGSAEASFQIRPRSVTTLKSFDQPLKSYDGGTGISFEAEVDALSGDEVTAACQGTFSDRFVGSGKEVTIHYVTFFGPDSDCYQPNLKYPIIRNNGQITAAVPEVQDKAELAAGGHTLDLKDLISNTARSQTVRFALKGQTAGSTLSEDGILTSGSALETLRVSVDIDPYDVNGDGKPEYTLAQETITVDVVEKESQDPVTVDPGNSGSSGSSGSQQTSGSTEPVTTGNTQAALSFYGKSSVSYNETLTLNVTGGSGSGAIVYTVRPGTGDAVVDSNGVLTPKRAGTVWVTAQKKGDDRYKDGTPVSMEVSIQRAKITVTVADKTAKVGDSVPELSRLEYTVTGLKSGESLKSLPSLYYQPKPDMKKEGSVLICASGAEVPSKDNYNPDITYQPGTLTISKTTGYTITLVRTENGTITADRPKGEEGTRITITAKADEGFVCREVTVRTRSDKSVSVTKEKDGVYTFVMPAASVNVYSVFAEGEAIEEAVLPFSDVKESDWFYDSVDWAWRSGLMNGTSDTLFSPKMTTSRAMIVTLLYRLEGSPEAPKGMPFSDVAGNAWYADPVAWAVWNGIVTGYSSTVFGPNDPITREQFAVILHRYAGFRGLDVSCAGSLAGFTDGNQVSSYAREAMIWANDRGLITGTGQGVLNPKGQATRAQAATILHRFVQQYPGGMA